MAPSVVDLVAPSMKLLNGYKNNGPKTICKIRNSVIEQLLPERLTTQGAAQYFYFIFNKLFFLVIIRGQRERSPPLPKITHPSYPHLG